MMLGEEVSKPPGRRRHYAEFASQGWFRPVGENNLGMFCENFLGNFAAVGSQRVTMGSNHEKCDTGQALIGQRIRDHQQ
jgi:hypothetical protein